MGFQFKGPSKVDKAMIIADPAAAFMGYLSTALATFGVFDKLGMSADQIAILGGAALGMVATISPFVPGFSCVVRGTTNPPDLRTRQK